MKFLLRLRRATIKAAIASLAGLVPVLACSQAEGIGLPASGAADLVQRFADEVEALSANFEQSVFDIDGELIESSSGRFELLRPNRFAWYYDLPFELVVIADATSLWMYDVEIEQVTVAPLSDLPESPAMLLSGEGSVGDNFAVSEVASGDGLRWIELKPLGDEGDFSSARIAFSDGLPRALELVDGLAETTLIEFTDIDTEPGLRARDFNFEPPRGVDVIGERD